MLAEWTDHLSFDFPAYVLGLIAIGLAAWGLRRQRAEPDKVSTGAETTPAAEQPPHPPEIAPDNGHLKLSKIGRQFLDQSLELHNVGPAPVDLLSVKITTDAGDHLVPPLGEPLQPWQRRLVMVGKWGHSFTAEVRWRDEGDGLERLTRAEFLTPG